MPSCPALFLSVSLSLLAASIDTDAATFTVGTDANGSCTHSSIGAAVQAAAATPGPDEILLTFGTEYSGPVLIPSGDLVLAGGYADCSATAPVGRSVIRGSTGKPLPVLEIAAGNCTESGPSTVRIDRLDIVGGPSHGLFVQGCVDVHLSRARIADNSAAFGAGVAMSGLGPVTRLDVGDDVRIENNTATEAGAGFYVFAASLRIGGIGTVVRGNSVLASEGRGGGLAIFGTTPPLEAKLSIVSGGEGGDGIVSNNTASIGGGIWASGETTIEAYTTDPLRPVRFDHNQASRGGAIFASAADLIVVEALIEANRASSGAAISLEAGAQLVMQSLPISHPLDAVACMPSSACNRLSGNDATNQDTSGAIVRTDGGGAGDPTTAHFSAVRIADNIGNTIFGEPCFGSTCPPIDIEVGNSLITANLTTHLLSAQGVSSFRCDLCTIAGQSPSSQPLLRSSGTISLSRTIVWEPGRKIVGGLMPASLDGQALQLHDRSSFPSVDFPPDLDIQAGDPRFVAATTGDFHPGINSPVLDRAWNSGTPESDLDGHPRAIDQPGIPDMNGVVDLGAFERDDDGASSDLIFRNGFD